MSDSESLWFRGVKGDLEVMPGGIVEEEAEEKGERIYQLSDLAELLRELAEFKHEDE